MIGNLKRKISRLYRRSGESVALSRPKVFAIGFNKCATTSLHTLFTRLGLSSYHGERWRECRDEKLLRSFDCFSDGVPEDLARLDSMFPGARFILQVRELDSWAYSRLAHIEREKERGLARRGEYWDNTEHSVDLWIKHRNEHHIATLAYFAERPEDLLIVNYIRDPLAAAKICRFLGREEIEDKPRTHTNPKKVIPDAHREMLARCASKLGIPARELKYDIFCPSIVPIEMQRRFRPDTDRTTGIDDASAGESRRVQAIESGR